MFGRTYFILAALALVAACQPAQPDPVESGNAEEVGTSGASDPTSSEVGSSEEYAFTMVYNPDVLRLLVETKVFAEFCGREFHLAQMKLIEQAIADQMTAFYKEPYEGSRYQALDALHTEARTLHSEDECGRNAPISSAWERVVLPKFVASTTLVKASPLWDVQEPYAQEAVDYLYAVAEQSIPLSLQDGFLANLDRESPAIASAAKNYLRNFFATGYVQKRLIQNGYRAYVRKPEAPGANVDHRYGLYSFSGGEDLDFTFFRAERVPLHWRLLDVHSSGYGFIMPGVTPEGRLRLIGFQKPDASELTKPHRMTILAQEEPVQLTGKLLPSREGAMRFVANVEFSEDCPGDFCATFGDDLTDWLKAQSSPILDWNYELYIGNLLSYPIPNERDPNHAFNFALPAYDVINQAERFRRSQN